MLAASTTARAQNIGWPEAVGRLAGERTKAETCVALLKGYGSAAQIARGQLAYSDAKANSDVAITGLIAVLAEGEKPESLPILQAKLASGTTALAQLCGMVSDLLPAVSGSKNVIIDIAKAAIEPLLKALTDGVAALYNNHRKDDALTRATIRTQLEAATWPAFKDVKPAR